MIELEGVRKRLGRRVVLGDVTARGEGLVALRGANGSGKSTLLRIIAGQLVLDGGGVRVAGVELTRERCRALSLVGYVPEGPEYPAHLYVRELFELVCALRGAPIPTFGEPVGALLGLRYEALSLGQRRRVHLALGLVADPVVLLADEPTNGLDAEAAAELLETLFARAGSGRTVLAATHDPRLLERAPHLWSLEAGALTVLR